MTSEPSQQPEDNAHQRGFGLFDAPPAPEEFPVFTPYQPVTDNEADAFPPDSDSGQPAPFGGFPSDDSALPEWSSSADSYVPAPAVMPIPGVRHDMDPPPSSSGWSTSSESYDSYEPDPYSHPSDPNPYNPPSESGLYGQAPEPEVDESPAGTWSAFAAGDAPKLAPAPTPWAEAAGYEPASSFDGPSTWDQPAESAPVAFQEPEPVSPPPYVPAAPPPPPAAPPPPPSAMGSVRVAASVPASNRLSPEEAAPAVIPRPAGRVYGSAAAATPAEAPPVDPAPIPADPQPAVRATARAAVSVARPEPGEAPPPATRSSTVYGSPVSPEAPQLAQAAPAPVTLPQRPGRQHTFGDLLSPAAPEAPPVLAAPAPAVPAQRMPVPGSPPPPGTPFGAPPPSLGGNVPPAATQRPPAAPNRNPNQAMADQFAKPSTTTGSLPAEPKPERKGRIIIGVLVGCVALLAVAFGGLILIDKLFNGPVFVVGDCVKQSDGIAIKAECTESGAFEVKAAVSSPEQCQDQVQPHVQQKDQILCLAPAVPPISANPTATPKPTATSTPTTQ